MRHISTYFKMASRRLQMKDNLCALNMKSKISQQPLDRYYLFFKLKLQETNLNIHIKNEKKI